MKIKRDADFSIVALDKFVQATRDSGYKGTSSAVAELVDNAIQADADDIAVSLTVDESIEESPVVLSVIDNGSGMDAVTLRTALRFGGSSRFNDRTGLGRYGMGLPNSSFSQARRVGRSDQSAPQRADRVNFSEGTTGEMPVAPERNLGGRETFH